MTNNRTIVGETVLKYLEKYPAMQSRTLASLLFKENHALFLTLDSTRTAVRYYRGRSGNQCRKELGDRRFELPTPTEENPYQLPPSYAEEYVPYYIPSELKCGLVLADPHFPYQNNEAITTALGYAKKRPVDFIVLNGDTIDAYQISRFAKDPRLRSFEEELASVEQFLAVIRKMFPKAHIVYKQGNHDRRLEDYLKLKAPELFGLKEFELRVLLRLIDYGIDWVGGKRIIQCGKLPIIHGDELWTSLTNPVNPARGLFLKAKDLALCAHHHQVSMHTEKDINGRQITTWSMGCLCDLNPEYMPINKWGHGFVLIDKTPDGEFELENKRIWQGRVI